MVTPPASPEPGEMGGIVMARLSARGPPGESPGPAGMAQRMERIQEPISALRGKNALYFTTQAKSQHIKIGNY